MNSFPRRCWFRWLPCDGCLPGVAGPPGGKSAPGGDRPPGDARDPAGTPPSTTARSGGRPATETPTDWSAAPPRGSRRGSLARRRTVAGGRRRTAPAGRYRRTSVISPYRRTAGSDCVGRDDRCADWVTAPARRPRRWRRTAGSDRVGLDDRCRTGTTVPAQREPGRWRRTARSWPYCLRPARPASAYGPGSAVGGVLRVLEADAAVGGDGDELVVVGLDRLAGSGAGRW